MKKLSFPAPAPRRDEKSTSLHYAQTQDKPHSAQKPKDTFPEASECFSRNALGADHTPARPDTCENKRPQVKKRSQRNRFTSAIHASGPTEAPLPEEHSEAHSFLPGIKPVTELLLSDSAKIDVVFIRKGRKGKDTDAIIDLCRRGNVRFSLVDESILEKIWRGRNQGVIARLFASGFADSDELLAQTPACPLPLIVALDQVQDPGNAGAIARTLYAMGGAGLVIPKHNGVYLGAAASRVAAGALEKLPVAKPANLGQALDAARDAGFTVYGAASEAMPTDADTPPAINAFAFKPIFPAVLVLGSEEAGLRPGIAKRCDAFITIPFAREFNSLNVAQAGAIIIAAFASGRSGLQQ